MRVLLVYPDILPSVGNYKGYFYTGLSSIAAYLKSAGHEVKLLHLTSEPERTACVSLMKQFDPALVGISATTNQFSFAQKVAKWVRETLPKAVIVSGGIHSILNADKVVQLPEFDLVCRGEGEYPMLHLVNRLEKGEDWRDTPSMWMREADGSVRMNLMLPTIEDLDQLPWPDRDIWDYANLSMESRGAAVVMFSRGCPYSCTYCCNKAISKVLREEGGKYLRMRSVDSVIRELKHIKDKYTFIKVFNFDDDNLFVNLEWSTVFAQQYADEIALPFSCNLYPSLIDARRVALLKRAGCVDLRIGLESGNEDIRAKVLKRKVSDESIRQAYHICREAGINTRSFVMVGLPGETPETVLETIRLVADEKVGIAHYSIFNPYRGTELFDYSVAQGYVTEDIGGELSDYYTSSVMTMPTMSRAQIEMFRNYFPVFVVLYRIVNFLPKFPRKLVRNAAGRFLAMIWLPNMLNPLYRLLRFTRDIIPHRLGWAASSNE